MTAALDDTLIMQHEQGLCPCGCENGAKMFNETKITTTMKGNPTPRQIGAALRPRRVCNGCKKDVGGGLYCAVCADALAKDAESDTYGGVRMYLWGVLTGGSIVGLLMWVIR